MGPVRPGQVEPTLMIPQRITSFLLSNVRPLHTLAITTHNGKLLSAATPLTATVLRRQCAIAAAIVADTDTDTEPVVAAKPGLLAMALEDGTAMLVRTLRNGMLLVSLGTCELPSSRRETVREPGRETAKEPGKETGVEPAKELGKELGEVRQEEPGTGQQQHQIRLDSMQTGASEERFWASPLAERLEGQAEAMAGALEDLLGSLHVPEEGIFAIS